MNNNIPRNHTSEFVSVILSTQGESEKTKVVRKKFKKRKRKGPLKIVSTQRESEKTKVVIKKFKKRTRKGPMKIVSTQGESEKTMVVRKKFKKRKRKGPMKIDRETKIASKSSGVLDSSISIHINTEVIVLDSTVSCEKKHTSLAANFRKKRKRSKPQTPSGLDSSTSILNERNEAEIGHGGVVMKQVEQDGEVSVIETHEIPTSEGKNAINVDVIVSDSTVSCENNRASTDLSTVDQPVQQHEVKNKEVISEIQNSLSTLVSKRKLLVMDMNGILVDVAWKSPRHPEPDIVVSRKGVYKRPFCDDFLEFCFERFDVAVWSSRVRDNLDKIVDFVMGDSKKRLLFCWDQSHCTQTGFNTRENRQKPLVLKELRKIWEKQVEEDLPWEKGYYNETNTVLLDDSPYKALRNPPNTAVFLHPYSCCEMVADQSLGPDGDLRKYLIRLSEAENVQKFIEENPFGQDPITESTPCWDFYRKIAEPPTTTTRKGSNGPPLKKHRSSNGAEALDKREKKYKTSYNTRSSVIAKPKERLLS